MHLSIDSESESSLNMRILLTGSSGQLGHGLLPRLQSIGQVWAPQRSEFDLSNPESLRSKIGDFSPDLVVNAGAYTAVDRAEDEVDLCFRVNAEAPRVLAEESSRLDACMIHYSTDYVFDGKKAEPYTEQDDPNPLNVYGESKLKGELEVLQTNEKSYVLRTSWVFDPAFGNNFYRTMMRLFRERMEVSVVDDQFGRPTSVQFLVSQTLGLVKSRCMGVNQLISDDRELYHLAELDRMSWADFASWILSCEKSVEFMCSSIKRVSSDEYPTQAERPRSSILCCDKWMKMVGGLQGGQ